MQINVDFCLKFARKHINSVSEAKMTQSCVLQATVETVYTATLQTFELHIFVWTPHFSIWTPHFG